LSPSKRLDVFPITTQFSQVSSGRGWKGQAGPLAVQELRDTYQLGPLDRFGRESPPAECVYSPEYARAVRREAEKALATLQGIPRLYNVFPYQDEPFHWGPKPFGYNTEVKEEFKKRYGYDLPPDVDSIRSDPKRWLDAINFLLTGYGISADARHWESFGEGLRLIQRAGGRLLDAPKVKAKADACSRRSPYLAFTF
jgi:hypothetical protein